MIPLFKVGMSPRAYARAPEVLASGYIGQGPEVVQFEQEFHRLVGGGVPPLSVNSCTSAIDLALHLCGVGPGDVVISTPVTCLASNVHIVHRGARIVWADVDPETGLIDPEDVARKARALERRTRAKVIIAVDWGGAACNYQALKQNGVPVIQDAAHRLLGPHAGDYVCWSFQAIKALTTGDGGALRVPINQYERAKSLRWYGLDRESGESFRCNQSVEELGYKYHMNDLAAAIGRSNLALAARGISRQRSNAARYSGGLRSHPHIEFPLHDPDSSWWIYTIRSQGRDGLQQYLERCGIASSPVHARNDKHPAMEAFTGEELPGVDQFCRTNLAIPVGWWLSGGDLCRVEDSLAHWAT